MEWKGKEQYNASAEVPFVVAGSEAGLLKSYGPLSFLKVCSPLSIINRVAKMGGVMG